MSGPDAAQVDAVLALFRAGRLTAMQEAAQRLTQRWPGAGIGWKLLGTCFQALGRSAQALDALKRAAALLPEDHEVHNNLGVALKAVGRQEQAVASFERAVAIKADYVEAQLNLGVALNEQNRFDGAAACFGLALYLDPERAQTYNNLGIALAKLGRREEALAHLRRAVAIDPGYAEAHCNLGVMLREADRLAEGLEHLSRAVALNPDVAEFRDNLGIALNDAGRLDEALDQFKRAVALQPGLAGAHNNLGVALKLRGRVEEAAEHFRRAAEIDPDGADAQNNVGAVLTELGELDQALAAYEGAYAAEARVEYLLNAAFVKRMMCAWQAAEADEAGIVAALGGALPERDRPSPFCLLAIPGATAEMQRQCAAHFAGRYAGRAALNRPVRTGQGGERLRLGYLSNDLHAHPTACLIAELIERHDRERFEVVALDYGPSRRDAYRQRLERAFDRWLRIDSLSDESAARLIARQGIDIAIDLGGWTRDTRSPILAYRPAPLQIQWLGYPGTMGAAWMDYVIADRSLIPPGEEGNYSEKIIRLADTYQPNDRQRHIGRRPERAAEGLPEQALVLACFNQSYKLTEPVFGVWMDVLRAVPGSVLWLLDSNVWAGAAHQAAAILHGVDPQRLVFAKPLPLAEHLGRLQLADLALDCTPYASHTTASDALWAGVPLVGLRGETFASRVSASILGAARLPELVTHSLAEYRNVLLKLTRDAGALRVMRARVAEARVRSPLFDSARFTRQLEAALEAAWDRHEAGLPPDHLDIAADV
jgi:predicted O-linked N-acetylglucosamine transferase (SPINDLY family)